MEKRTVYQCSSNNTTDDHLNQTGNSAGVYHRSPPDRLDISGTYSHPMILRLDDGSNEHLKRVAASWGGTIVGFDTNNNESNNVGSAGDAVTDTSVDSHTQFLESSSCTNEQANEHYCNTSYNDSTNRMMGMLLFDQPAQLSTPTTTATISNSCNNVASMLDCKPPHPQPPLVASLSSPLSISSDSFCSIAYNNNNRILHANTSGRQRRCCRIVGCKRVIKSQGLCQKHGAKIRHCKILGCWKQAQGSFDGMCSKLSLLKGFISSFVPLEKIFRLRA